MPTLQYRPLPAAALVLDAILADGKAAVGGEAADGEASDGASLLPISSMGGAMNAARGCGRRPEEVWSCLGCGVELGRHIPEKPSMTPISSPPENARHDMWLRDE